MSMLHELIRTWFEWVELWGYAGVLTLMAMESSIIPVPSELVIPPAAFWATRGRMDFWLVVLAGTIGSYVGSVISYWVAYWIGHPLLQKYGKYLLISPAKLDLAERWMRRFGTFGIFTARFLPVVRHLISIPAGAFRMPFWRFSLATITGAGIWCWVLAFFGQKILGDDPELLESPEIMIQVIQAKMDWFLSLALIMLVLYGLVVWFKSKQDSLR